MKGPARSRVGPHMCGGNKGGVAAPRRARADDEMADRVRASPLHRRWDPPPPWYQGGGGATASSFLVGPSKAHHRLYPRQHEWTRQLSTLDVAMVVLAPPCGT